MDDTMKEEKVGKKPKGAVLVISIGKPSDKSPMRAADPDTKEKAERNPPAFLSKATPAELMGEAERMRGAGEKGHARRFADVASQMERGPALRESTIERLGTEASQLLGDDEDDREAFARFLYGEGKRGADYQDMRINPSLYDPSARRRFMKVMSQMERQKGRAEAMESEGQEQLQALRAEDPTRFFADQDMVQRALDNLEALDALQKGAAVDFCSCCTPSEIAWAIAKAKKKSKPFHGYNPNRHHKKGGLNAKGRAKAKRETGANLKPPVTTKPSKLKPGSKKAKRRKSFCARMGGMKGPTSKKGKLTPKGAALRRWNC